MKHTTVDCKRTGKTSKNSTKYKVDLRFYKGSPTFYSRKTKKNKQTEKPNYCFSGKVLRKEIFEIDSKASKIFCL